MSEPVKVQLPVDFSGKVIKPATKMLVYGEGRKNMMEMSPTPEILEALGAGVEGYFEGHWSINGWVIGRRVEDKRW